jgi:hypothetical protein
VLWSGYNHYYFCLSTWRVVTDAGFGIWIADQISDTVASTCVLKVMWRDYLLGV